MKLWWLRDFQRVATEKAAVETLSSSEPWLSLDGWSLHEGRLAALGVITAHGHSYPVRLLYPDQFPDVPAWVEPQADVKWSHHQYGSGGALCLELRPDNWDPTATGGDVLRSAYNLLNRENPLGAGSQSVAPSAHNVGQIQAFDWGAPPVLISAGCHSRIAGGAAVDLRAVRWLAEDGVSPVIVHDATDRTSARRPPEPDLLSLRQEVPVYVSARAPPEGAPSRRALLEAGDLDPAVVDQLAEKGLALVLFRSEAGLVAHLLVGDAEPQFRKLFMLPQHDEARSGRPLEAARKRVTIVGIGSVGSKIAESLARSGVSRITLVDGDVMLPGNLERHTLDWRDVGLRKAKEVKRRILNIAPGAEVLVIDDNLNWQRSAKLHALQVAALAQSDLIVDATGDAPTSLFLGGVANANRRAFVSVEVYEGGIGASVATCVPAVTPSFANAQTAFRAWCEERGVAPPRPGPRAYEAVAEDGAPMVADDAAVTMAAGHATRVILDVLDGRPAGPEGGWMLFGFRAGWVFERHGHNFWLNVGAPSKPPHDTQDDSAQAFVRALIEEENLNARSTGEESGGKALRGAGSSGNE